MDLLRLACLAGVVLLGECGGSVAPAAAGPAEPGYLVLSVPLDKDGAYSLHDLLRECNRTLKTSYPLDRISDRRITITPEEKRWLQLAVLTGLDRKLGIQLRIEPARFVLRLPDPENDAVREKYRRFMERTFKAPLPDLVKRPGLTLPEAFDPKARTVLFVHGLGSSSSIFAQFAKACEDERIQVLRYDYYTDALLKDAAKRLADDLHELGQKHPTLRLVVVAHSLGGLIARHAVEVARPELGWITDLVTLGTPHHGSNLAINQPFVEVLDRLVNWKGPKRAFGPLLGEAAFDLRPGSRFLKELDAAGLNRRIRYHVVAGSKAWVGAEDVVPLQRLAEAALRRGNVPEQETLRLTEYLRNLDEIVTDKGDGAVTLASAKLQGSSTERVLPVDHLALPMEPRVFAHVFGVLGWTTKQP